MAGETLLIIDDDLDLKSILRMYLVKEGFKVITSTVGKDAVHLVNLHKPSLIILDVLLPDIDGYEVCRLLRQKTDAPILFVSSKEEDFDKILAHRIGGDDYITKPFSPAVLVAKVQAHLRRKHTSYQQNFVSEQKDRNLVLVFKDLYIDKLSCIVKMKNRNISLSAKEFQLLCLMADNPNRVFNVEQMFENIWGEDSLGDYRTVMVHISNLRKKIEPNPSEPIYIITLRGMGYKFNAFDQ
ncbi:response regulator transcription factor [Metabacillus litoralis]|uniref:response regulator transcription factor n=1 Tax=Metabacillus litoralis TaxID=152268 RepID=UPI001CFC9940|nr:response regulator transcription factor [Metabacillus litoralis]